MSLIGGFEGRTHFCCGGYEMVVVPWLGGQGVFGEGAWLAGSGAGLAEVTELRVSGTELVAQLSNFRLHALFYIVLGTVFCILEPWCNRRRFRVVHVMVVGCMDMDQRSGIYGVGLAGVDVRG